MGIGISSKAGKLESKTELAQSLDQVISLCSELAVQVYDAPRSGPLLDVLNALKDALDADLAPCGSCGHPFDAHATAEAGSGDTERPTDEGCSSCACRQFVEGGVAGRG